MPTTQRTRRFITRPPTRWSAWMRRTSRSARRRSPSPRGRSRITRRGSPRRWMHAPFSVGSADNMPIERIQDPADARVDAFRAVRDGELLRTRGQFVAEGRIIVRRVVEDARCRVQSVLVNGAALADLADVLETLTAPVYVASGEVLNAIGGYDVHRGCLAM